MNVFIVINKIIRVKLMKRIQKLKNFKNKLKL